MTILLKYYLYNAHFFGALWAYIMSDLVELLDY